MTDVVINTDVVMHARDGTPLAADVYRLDDDAQRPVLLHRTPYERTQPTFISGIVVDPVWLARRGYVVVVQDVRGRFGSGGEYDFFYQEKADGYDAVEWAAAQPWSTGRIGVYGSSYHAMSTFGAVAARPPHLQAAVALAGAAGMGDTVRPGGMFELGFLTSYVLAHSFDTITRLDGTDERRAELAQQVLRALGDGVDTVSQLPVADIAGLNDGRIAPFWSRWIDNEPDSSYWNQDTLVRDPGRVSVPLLQVTGFMDFLSPTMLELFDRIQDDGRHALVAGPWTHYGTYTGHAGARDYRATAGGGTGTLGPIVAAWFDRWLRDEDARPVPPVRYFCSGQDRWVQADRWPPPSSERSFFLGSDGHANTRSGDGTLFTAAPESGNTADTFLYDPRDPVPTCGGVLASPGLGPDGVQDQRAVEDRLDVLVYTSAELDEPLRVAGHVRLTLFFASSAEDTDVTAKLVDVEPSGFAANVSEGGLRLRYRHGGHDAWLTPGEVVEVTVELHQIAHRFAPGHRVRLEVSSSSFPRLSRNLNCRVLPERGGVDDIVVAEQVVVHDAEHPSRLVLPALGG